MYIKLIILIIVLFILLIKKKENFKNNYDLIISINVHEKIDFLLKQLKNIDLFVKLKYLIILNPSKNFYGIVKEKTKNLKNVIVNENHFDKRRTHGSILKGIYCNMLLALEKYDFKYFIILSSRSLFFNKLSNLQQINNLKIEHERKTFHTIFKSVFTKKKKNQRYYNFLKKNDLTQSSSPHEGLTLDIRNCITIKNFIEKNKYFQKHIFTREIYIEEDLFQSICYKFNKYFHFIGQMNTSTKIDIENFKKNNLKKDSLVYKSNRH